MSSVYYILENAQKTGPFDLMSMVKRIRSARLEPKTPVFVGSAEHPVDAISIPELHEFFKGDSAPVEQAPQSTSHHIIDLNDALKDAWRFFSNHQSIVLVGGVFALVLLVISYALGLALPAAVVSAFTSIAGGFIYYVYLVYILNVVRGEKVTASFVNELKQSLGKPLLFSGAIAAGLTLGLPALLGSLVSNVFYLFIIPGFIAYSLFIFTPFLIADNRNLNYIEALKQSSSWIRSQGMDNMGAIVALIFFNVVGMLAFFFPIFITLPLSAIALADIYERSYTRQS